MGIVFIRIGSPKEEEKMKEQIILLLENKEYKRVQGLLNGLNPANIAEILEDLDSNALLVAFRLLTKDNAVEVFSFLTNATQEKIISVITEKEVKSLVDELYFDDMIDLLEEMPANIVKKILSNVQSQERSLVNQFLKYPENSAGSLMTIEYVDLKRNITVREALNDIKRTGLSKETIYTSYVIDLNRKLEGIVSLRELVTSEDHERIEDIMKTDIVYVHTHEDQEVVAGIFKKYDLLAIPVVDHEDRLVGIITFDDIMDVIDAENTEDFYKMAAMAPTEEDYLSTKTLQLAKNRITWLLVLMISAIFTGYIIRSYEVALQKVVILASFIPMLMDTGGNAGSQSSTLIIRGLALGEVEPKDILKIILKEFKVSIIVGFVLALLNFLRIFYFDHTGVGVALTVSITLFMTVILAKIVGGVLPIVASKLKLDPAIMASPLITTIVDALSLIIFFQLASLFLGI